MVKTKVEISQNFVAFSEYMNFIKVQVQPLWLPTHYELILAFFKQSLNVKFWWAPKGARGRGERKIWMGTGGQVGQG